MLDFLFSDGVFYCLGILLVYIPVFHKTLKEESGMVKNKFLKRFFKTYPKPTGWGFIFIVLIVITFFINYKRDLIENKEKDDFNAQLLKAQIKSDSLVRDAKNAEAERRVTEKALLDYMANFSQDLIRRDTLMFKQLDKWGLSIKDSIIYKKDVMPTLTITDMPTITELNNEKLFSYSLRAFNADAHLLSYYYVAIIVREGVFKSYEIIEGNAANFSTIIPNNYVLDLHLFLDRIPNRSDTLMIVMQFDYKSKSNKRLTPVRKMYSVTLSPANSVMPVSNSYFIQISNYLKRKKVWDKFYDL